jgi:hypothetical protein
MSKCVLPLPIAFADVSPIAKQWVMLVGGKSKFRKA